MRLKSLLVPDDTAICGLLGWRHRCSEGFNWHHLVNRTKLLGNSKARHFAEKTHPEIFLVRVCGFSNRSRLADEPEAQAILLQSKVEDFGIAYVSSVWTEFRELWTDFPPEFELTEILRHLPDMV